MKEVNWDKMEYKTDFKFRLAKRDCYCRGCDKVLKRDTDMLLATYSFRNRGQYIYFCVDCVKEMNKLIEDKEKEIRYNHNESFASFKLKVDLIKNAGFNIIGVSQLYFEVVYIFETQEEALKTFDFFEGHAENIIIVGWWYDKEQYLEEVALYENVSNYTVKTYWL